MFDSIASTNQICMFTVEYRNTHTVTHNQIQTLNESLNILCGLLFSLHRLNSNTVPSIWMGRINTKLTLFVALFRTIQFHMSS